MLFWKLSVFEIPLAKELTVNSLLDTCMKFGQLILAAIVLCGLIRVPGPFWLAAIPVWWYNWYGITWATVVNKHL